MQDVFKRSSRRIENTFDDKQHVLLKKITIFPKIQISKKITV